MAASVSADGDAPGNDDAPAAPMTPAISYARVDLVQEQQSPRSSDTIDLTRSGNNIIGDNNDEVIDNAAITGKSQATIFA